MSPTSRFTSRVGNYARYRPSYPPRVVDILEEAGLLSPHAHIADIGSGTGILARLFLDRGYRVTGVEPNAAMRAAGDELLNEYAQFESVSGAAEQTTLRDNSVALITVGQALHWFDIPAFRGEAKRILKHGGGIAVVFNDRDLEAGDFMREYDALLHKYSEEYGRVRARYVYDENCRVLFGGEFNKVILANHQSLDEQGLLGRTESSSYCPKREEAGYDGLMRGLRESFEKYQTGGAVRFSYRTTLLFGCCY